MSTNNEEMRIYYMSKKEYELLESLAYLEPFIVDIIETAKVLEGGKYTVRISEQDIDDIEGAIECQIGVEKKNRREGKELLGLYEKIKEKGENE